MKIYFVNKETMEIKSNDFGNITDIFSFEICLSTFYENWFYSIENAKKFLKKEKDDYEKLKSKIF